MTGYQYNCAGGETFDSVAFVLFDDEKYAVDLMSANPEYCDRAVFTGGEAILIPDIDNSADEDQLPVEAPWKE